MSFTLCSFLFKKVGINELLTGEPSRSTSFICRTPGETFDIFSYIEDLCSSLQLKMKTSHFDGIKTKPDSCCYSIILLMSIKIDSTFPPIVPSSRYQPFNLDDKKSTSVLIDIQKPGGSKGQSC